MPSDAKNVVLIKDFMDAFNRHNLEEAMSYVANDAMLVTIGDKRIEGWQDIKDYLGGFFKEAPNVKGNLKGALFATDEWGFAEWTITGAGPQEINGGDLFAFKNGKITQLGGFAKQS